MLYNFYFLKTGFTCVDCSLAMLGLRCCLGLSVVRRARASGCAAWAAYSGGFRWRGAQTPGTRASCAARGLWGTGSGVVAHRC